MFRSRSRDRDQRDRNDRNDRNERNDRNDRYRRRRSRSRSPQRHSMRSPNRDVRRDR